MPFHLIDQQQALAFAIPQFYNIERTIYEVRYPSFDYASLIPVVTEGSPWARGTVFYSMDSAGKAEWLSGTAFDMPYADIERQQFVHGFHMAGIGYEWNLEEISVAQQEGMPLNDLKARAARRVAERMLWRIALVGDEPKNWTGLANDPNVPSSPVAGSGSGGSTDWRDKNPQQILADVNEVLAGVITDTEEVEYANTLLLPTEAYLHISVTPVHETSNTTILQFLQQNNAYSAQTGQGLTVRGIRALRDAGEDGGGRMVAYRRDPEVLRFHLPMPHRFLPPYQKGSMTWEVGGIMRTGGVEIRLPMAVRYADGIWATE